MAKNRLHDMPPEVRVNLAKIPLHDLEARREFDRHHLAAFHALARHYGLDPGPPAQPDFWPQLAMNLAADFLPAFYWYRRKPPAPRGRRKSVDAAALDLLLAEREKLTESSDKNACRILAARWRRRPAESPFQRKLSESTLRDYLGEARQQRTKQMLLAGKAVNLFDYVASAGWRARRNLRRKRTAIPPQENQG